MTDDGREQRFDEAFEDGYDGQLPEAGTPGYVEIERFADALSRLDAGDPAGVDSREDPELAALLETVARVQRRSRVSTQARSFRSFQARSRSAILHALDEDRREALAQEQSGLHGKIVPFAPRTILAPAAAAAAAAVLLVAGFAGGVLPLPGGSGGPQVVHNLTPLTTTDELTRISAALADIQARTEKGEAVPAPLLREVAESAARVANMIERTPDQLDRASIETYSHAVQTSQSVLATVRAEPDAEGELALAQSASRDGAVVASRYLTESEREALEDGEHEGEGGDSEAEGRPSPTTPPTPTPEPTPIPTETPDATSTPEDGDEDDPDDDDEVTPATPSPATPTPTPTPSPPVAP